jgi:hypothetical protein
MKILRHNANLRHLILDDLDASMRLYSDPKWRYFRGHLTYEETKDELQWFLNGILNIRN